MIITNYSNLINSEKTLLVKNHQDTYITKETHKKSKLIVWARAKKLNQEF